jgi:hypothetical protein
MAKVRQTVIDALIYWDNQHYILVDDGENCFRFQPVKILAKNDSLILITSADLNPDKKYVSGNAYGLLMAFKNKSEE